MYFLSDCFGTAAAVCIFPLLLFVPGYVCGFLANLLEFRRASFRWRIVISVPLSVALVPLAIYLILLAHALALFWIALVLTQVLAVSLAFGRLGHERPAIWIPGLRAIPQSAAWIALAWFLIATLSLADLQFGDRLYHSVVVYDHAFRVAVTDAVTRTGIPAVTPFNHLDGDIPLRYHIFWFALCSVAQTIGGGLLTARHALNASVIWCGFALMLLVPLSLRVFEGLEGPVLRRRAFIGVGLLSVTGLDLIPNLLYYLRHTAPPGDMEWWAADQVTSWADATLWVPHHVAALVAGFTGFLLIWHAALHCATRRASLAHATVAGVALASAVGCSIYVGFALATAISAWTAFTIVRGWYRHTALLLLAGAAGLVFAVPNILQIQKASLSGKFLELRLWEPLDTGPLYHALHDNLHIPFRVVDLLLVGVTYGVEFGFFLLAGILTILRFRTSRRIRPQDAASLVIAGAVFLLCTFVRSATISNNDLGWRGFMLLQLVLLLWATSVFDTQRLRWRFAACVLLGIGFAGTLYQLAMLRVFYIANDTGVFSDTAHAGAAGRLNYSLRTLYCQLDDILPRTAIVQSNPIDAEDSANSWGLYSHRQTVATGDDCLVSMGGIPGSCAPGVQSLRRLFDATVTDPEAARTLSRRFGLDAVIVKDSDPVWRNSSAWIYRQPPAVDTPHARAFLMSRQFGQAVP